jgi:hypothetical protein
VSGEPNTIFSDGQILHIFVEVANGRERHGDFLMSLAEAVARADTANFELLRDAVCLVIEKYELRKYLDTYENGEATA